MLTSKQIDRNTEAGHEAEKCSGSRSKRKVILVFFASKFLFKRLTGHSDRLHRA